MKKSLYILGQLSDRDVQWMISVGKKERLKSGTTLIEQGKQSNKLYIVLEGEFVVMMGGKAVTQLGVGEIIGEMSFVDSRPPSATVNVSEEAVLFSVLRSELTDKLSEDIGMAARFYRAIAVFLADRLRTSNQSLGGEEGQVLDEDNEQEDELDLDVLDNVHLAGARFEEILKRMSLTPFS